MEITCAQMDVLISFYIEGDLSRNLKIKVEEHLKKCPVCRAKFDIIKSMINDLKNSLNETEEEKVHAVNSDNQYRIFQNNLSAYIDNELSPEENIKIKKFTISNKKARRELENTYAIRKLMNDSFNKTKSEARHDFSKNVLKQLNLNEEETLAFNPILKAGIAFVMTVLFLSAIIVFSLTL